MADVVVIGGGLGGAAAAARLAKLGHQVTLLERTGRIGGALGFVEGEGYRWESGPHATALPAVLRDLFRKSGRPLERELDLLPVDPLREHRFEDGTAVVLPAGGRSAQREAIDEGLGPGLGRQWIDYTHRYADAWDVLRRNYLERPYSAAVVDKDVKAVIHTRESMARAVAKAFKDRRLRELALCSVRVDGHDPRDVPSWMAMMSYVEQNFGLWTVAGGMGELAGALARRLTQRRVDVRLGVTAADLVVDEGVVRGVLTDAGRVDADVVVCAIDPRRLPALAGSVSRTTPVLPPAISYLGLSGDLPELPSEVVLHGDPLLVVRTNAAVPQDRGPAWTVLARGQLGEDVVTALARRGLDVRNNIEVRIDRSPRELAHEWGGTPYGVLWQGRATLAHRLGTTTPLVGVFGAGAHAAPGAGVPFVGLGAALVAQAVGPAGQAPTSARRPE